ncbi:hypothetical protein [Neobacillus massiliamazoniensis]|uniref:Uncharacterized protein n=1 Tax=Neobacillus massiliamazoniensis TaxID=1499688 RepID=A0A0U1NZR3_9BACI|nr:hypothetical protein [Neobacillus massiliamazoniensis]CRK83332.1 hypothetical protein BN000_03296 [Neobacillus massiliamazoniensis]
MNKGTVLFVIIGLAMFMLGIYLSVYWAGIGIFLAVGGGIIMGSSSYFLAKKKD